MLEFIIVLFILLSFMDDTKSINKEETDMDDDLMPCTHEWRSLHPYSYNPYTGGWNKNEDDEHGR